MNRDKILELLQKERLSFVSGEDLSQRLGITRAAVWKCIAALRKEGYEIESRTRMGYRLCAVPDRISAEVIARQISTAVVGRNIECFRCIDSTNNYAKQRAQNGAQDGLVIVAERQSDGRGRCGRSFESEVEKGVYMTVLLRPEVMPQEILPITALAAVAACNAVERVCGVRPGIKWTNDLVLNGKKICGILTEMALEGESGRIQYVALGIGINVNHTAMDFSQEVGKIATSLAAETGKTVSRSALIAALLEEIDQLYAQIGKNLSDYLSAYKKDCVMLGKEVRVLGGTHEYRAIARDIDDAFGLVVERENGTLETIRSGEVSVRGMYGYV